jgi:hypothetical protein
MVVAEGKSQEVRLLDVFLLGPFMVWFGARAQDVPPWARQAMILSGVATIAYNGTNYLKIEAERRG